MPTAPALTRPPSRARPRGALVSLVVIGLALYLVALLTTASVLLADPARVDLTVENTTGYELNVRVRSSVDDNVLGLGPIGPRSTKDYMSVIDQGETWVFEYSYGGVVAATPTVSRSDLEAGTVQVPGSVEAELRSAGFEPIR